MRIRLLVKASLVFMAPLLQCISCRYHDVSLVSVHALYSLVSDQGKLRLTSGNWQFLRMSIIFDDFGDLLESAKFKPIVLSQRVRHEEQDMVISRHCRSRCIGSVGIRPIEERAEGEI